MDPTALPRALHALATMIEQCHAVRAAMDPHQQFPLPVLTDISEVDVDTPDGVPTVVIEPTSAAAAYDWALLLDLLPAPGSVCLQSGAVRFEGVPGGLRVRMQWQPDPDATPIPYQLTEQAVVDTGVPGVEATVAIPAVPRDVDATQALSPVTRPEVAA